MSSNYLNEIKDLFDSYKKGKHAEKKLSEFKQVLEKEVNMIKDIETASELKRKLYQNYANQQQDVLLKLLSVKEENTELKQNLLNIESKVTEIQNKRMADYVTKDAEIDVIKQDFMNELLKIQETTYSKLNKVKLNMNQTLTELKSTLSEKEEEVNKKLTNIKSLQDEIRVLKEKNTVNAEIYQQKIAEQRRQHLAERERWKMAELNRAAAGRRVGGAADTADYPPADRWAGGAVYSPQALCQEAAGGGGHFRDRRASVCRQDPADFRRALEPKVREAEEAYGPRNNAGSGGNGCDQSLLNHV